METQNMTKKQAQKCQTCQTRWATQLLAFETTLKKERGDLEEGAVYHAIANIEMCDECAQEFFDDTNKYHNHIQSLGQRNAPKR